ncbi:MAG: DinB family protein [Anaerolineae bacterium]|nr:DinB family protein [Anaerolineae bacterium]
MPNPTQLETYRSQLRETQQAFLDILTEAEESTLYQRHDAEGWTLAETLVHIAEARMFYADEIARLHAAPGSTIGRELTHPGRTQYIIDNARNTPEQIAAKLIESHDLMISTLTVMKDDELSLQGNHVASGEHTLAELVERYFVGHDQVHVAQARSLLSGGEA